MCVRTLLTFEWQEGREEDDQDIQATVCGDANAAQGCADKELGIQVKGLDLHGDLYQ